LDLGKGRPEFQLQRFSAMTAPDPNLFEMRRREFVAALFPILVLVSGTIVAGIAPQYASYLWLVAFAALLIRRIAGAPSTNS